jgi:hypothetical protein
VVTRRIVASGLGGIAGREGMEIGRVKRYDDDDCDIRLPVIVRLS